MLMVYAVPSWKLGAWRRQQKADEGVLLLPFSTGWCSSIPSQLTESLKGEDDDT
jgi:hypothetical protein